MEEVITPDTLSDGSQLNPADGGSADDAGSISLDSLKEVLGKDFKDTETALKSIKDTFSYVGRAGQVDNIIKTAKQTLNTDDQGVLQALNKIMESTQNEGQVAAPAPAAQPVEGFITKDQYEQDMFFSKNESLSEIRDILTPLKNANDATKTMSWSDFVNTDFAKKVVDSHTVAKQVQSERSVLESNPRLGAATDKISEAHKLNLDARNAEMAGDIQTARQMQTSARQNAVTSVIDAFGLK